jgi:hypothetical protein
MKPILTSQIKVPLLDLLLFKRGAGSTRDQADG